MAMIAGREILAVNKIAACCEEDNNHNNEEEERKRSLRFVSPRKTTLLLTLTCSLFCFITAKTHKTVKKAKKKSWQKLCKPN